MRNDSAFQVNIQSQLNSNDNTMLKNSMMEGFHMEETSFHFKKSEDDEE